MTSPHCDFGVDASGCGSWRRVVALEVLRQGENLGVYASGGPTLVRRSSGRFCGVGRVRAPSLAGFLTRPCGSSDFGKTFAQVEQGG